MTAKTLRRKDVQLSQGSAEAARSCLEAGYVLGLGIEASLALCAGIRESAGLESADTSMFEDELLRVLYRAQALASPMKGHDALHAEKLIDELERIALTSDGAGRIWDSLAAAVGDAEPSEADPRVIGIFRALRNRNALHDTPLRKSPRPSLSKRMDAIRAEREETRLHRESRPPAGSLHKATPPLELEPSSDIPATSARDPGKIALRLLSYLHQGYVLVDREGLPGGGASVSRLIPARPRFDRPESPRFILEYAEDWNRKHYDREYGWKLEWAGWITQMRDLTDSVYCLTTEGAQAAERIFGAPPTILPALDGTGRMLIETSIERLMSGDLDHSGFAAEIGIDEDDIDGLLDQICWYGDNHDLGDMLENWRLSGMSTSAGASATAP